MKIEDATSGDHGAVDATVVAASVAACTALSLAESSPQCLAVLDAPLANPVFLSDVPSFIHRQRNRAARAVVSEHAGTITCPCKKCAEAAREYAQQFGGHTVRSAICRGTCWDENLLGGTENSSVDAVPSKSASIKAHRPTISGFLEGASPRIPSLSSRAPSLAPAKAAEPQRDFAWLLRVLASFAPSDPAILQQRQVSLGWNFMKKTDAESLEGKLGITIPDTVLIKKAKPLSRYCIDAVGRVQVTQLKTSAELLRVLREFVRKANRPRLPASPDHRCRVSLSSSIGAARGSATRAIRACRSEVSLSSTGGRQSLTGESYRQPSPTAEVAVLYYTDRTSRLMMCAEATSQMNGASRLPREFWQHIRILQVPVQSKQVRTPTRYITYSFDTTTSVSEPQEPIPLGGGPQRSGLKVNPCLAVEGSEESEAARLKAVPKRINQLLAECNQGEVGYGLELISGQLEFVLDEADGTLWLVNAEKLRCRIRPPNDDELERVLNEDERRLFEEDEFTTQLQEGAAEMEKLKRRFGGDLGVAHGGIGVASLTVSASDKLAGVKVPQGLLDFYEEEERMFHYYEEEIKAPAMKREKKREPGMQAVGLQAWFSRWARKAMDRKAFRRRAMALEDFCS